MIEQSAVPSEVKVQADSFLTDLTEFRSAVRDEFEGVAAHLIASTVPRRPRLLCIDGVANHFGVSKRTVERLIADGRLRPVWVGGQRRFTAEAIAAFERAGERPRKRRRKQRSP